MVTYVYTSTGPDKSNDGLWKQSPFLAAYPEYDWHEISMWAWAGSRVVDFLQTQNDIDQTKLVLVGHSRIGKGVAWTGALDERFAVVAPAGSSGGGIGLYRINGETRGGKEGLETMAKNFSGQFGPHWGDFIDQVDKLPWDAHWLVALVAPRYFITLEGLSDQYSNSRSVAASYAAAKPVFDFLGVPGNIGINFRPGTHMLAEADWQALLDFSDEKLLGKKAKRRFDIIPPEDQLR